MKAVFTTLIALVVAAFFLFFIIRVLKMQSPQSGQVMAATKAMLIPGQAMVSLQTDQGWREISKTVALDEGAKIKTDHTGTAQIVFADDSSLILDPNTTIRLEKHQVSDQDSQIIIFQEIGNTWSQVEKLISPKSSYEIKTQTTVTAVRGTGFGMMVNDQQEVKCLVNQGEVTSSLVEYITGKRSVVMETVIQAQEMLHWPYLEDPSTVMFELKLELIVADPQLKLWVDKHQEKASKIRLFKDKIEILREKVSEREVQKVEWFYQPEVSEQPDPQEAFSEEEFRKELFELQPEILEFEIQPLNATDLKELEISPAILPEGAFIEEFPEEEVTESAKPEFNMDVQGVQTMDANLELLGETYDEEIDVENDVYYYDLYLTPTNTLE